MAGPSAPQNPPEWTAVDRYTTAQLHTSAHSSSSSPSPSPSTATQTPLPPPSPETLARIQENAARAGLPDIAVSAPQGAFLRLQALLLNARSVLEIGTLAGFSTAWLASALPPSPPPSPNSDSDSNTPQGGLVSLEVDPRHAAVARANLEQAGYAAPRVQVREGPALDAFAALEREVLGGEGETPTPTPSSSSSSSSSSRRAPFDLVFVDADKENGWSYVDRAARLARPGALIIVDNVVRRGALADARVAEADSRVRGSRLVVEQVGAQPERFEAAVLQTVGEKGYDGFLLIYVK